MPQGCVVGFIRMLETPLSLIDEREEFEVTWIIRHHIERFADFLFGQQVGLTPEILLCHTVVVIGLCAAFL